MDRHRRALGSLQALAALLGPLPGRPHHLDPARISCRLMRNSEMHPIGLTSGLSLGFLDSQREIEIYYRATLLQSSWPKPLPMVHGGNSTALH